MRDRFGRCAALTHLNVGGVAHDLEREPHHIVRHRRREEQGLARVGNRRDDPPHVRPEPHVHHAVRLVEHQQLDAAQIGVLLPQMIDQPSGRRDDDVDAGAKRALLDAHVDAAVHRGARDRRVIGQPVNLVLDLHRQLARRREHQHAGFRRKGARAGACAAQRSAWHRFRSTARVCAIRLRVAPVFRPAVSSR